MSGHLVWGGECAGPGNRFLGGKNASVTEDRGRDAHWKATDTYLFAEYLLCAVPQASIEGSGPSPQLFPIIIAASTWSARGCSEHFTAHSSETPNNPVG